MNVCESSFAFMFLILARIVKNNLAIIQFIFLTKGSRANLKGFQYQIRTSVK